MYAIASIGEYLQTDSTRYHRADAIVDALLKKSPQPNQLRRQSAVALHHIGLYYGEKGQTEHAVEVFEHALALRPGSEQVLGGLAEVYRQSGQTEQAINYYRRFVRTRPDMAAGHFNLTALLIKNKICPKPSSP